MKAILILAITLALCSCLSTSDKQQIERIQKSGWGKVVLDLAELHMESKGPVEDLIKAIEDLVVDLGTKQEEEENSFTLATSKHEEEVRRLEASINQAKLDISNAQKYLAETLRPQKAYYEDEIKRLTRLIEDTKKHIDDSNIERATQKKEYEGKVKQHQDVIGAIDEALKLLDSLEGGSFAQIKTKLTSSLKKIANHLNQKEEYAQWVQALIEIAEKDYADKDAVEKVVNLLNQIRQNASDSLDRETDAENKAVEAHALDVKNSQERIVQAGKDLRESRDNLATTVDAIAATEQTIVDRGVDQRQFEKALEAENSAYDQLKTNHEKLLEEFASELKACQEALDVIKNRNFADYIAGRVENDGPIASAHGDKLDVNKYTFGA